MVLRQLWICWGSGSPGVSLGISSTTYKRSTFLLPATLPVNCRYSVWRSLDVTMTLDAASGTLTPLPDVLSHGLVAVSTFGLLSFFCSTSLFIYLTYRLISWHVHAKIKSPPNQFLLLIYNLLLADIQQALAFMLNITALRNNGIFVETPTCWAQGWFVSTGDLASSVFICAIAVHTFASVIKEYRLPAGAFHCCIGGAWIFVYSLGALGPLIHGEDFYVRASAWVSHSFHIQPPRKANEP